MKRFVWAYAAWLAALLSAAALALWWWKQVESVGWREVYRRVSENGGAPSTEEAFEDASISEP